jgi:hypothetical protein
MDKKFEWHLHFSQVDPLGDPPEDVIYFLQSTFIFIALIFDSHQLRDEVEDTAVQEDSAGLCF